MLTFLGRKGSVGVTIGWSPIDIGRIRGLGYAQIQQICAGGGDRLLGFRLVTVVASLRRLHHRSSGTRITLSLKDLASNPPERIDFGSDK
jgi:hypothetical protein